MKLNYQKFGETGPVIVIVHGLFGSIANWRAVARELEKDFCVYVVDQRNHGETGYADSMTYFDMAADLDEFINTHELENFILCGHSMGGKAVMTYALSDFASKEELKSIMVLDIAPVVYTHSHAPYLESMMEVDLQSIQSRSEADKQLKEVITDNATRLFLMQSLEREGDSFRWKLNLSVLKNDMPNIVGFPVAELSKKSSLIPALFLHGSLSNYVTSDMHVNIERLFPKAEFDSVETGHWLHVEKRSEVIDSIRSFQAKL